MSLAQELNELGNLKAESKTIERSEPIRVRDLEVDKKYKVLKLHTFEWKRTHAGKIGTEVRIEYCSTYRHFVLPHRFRTIADYIDLKYSARFDRRLQRSRKKECIHHSFLRWRRID